MIARSIECVHAARVASVERYVLQVARRHARRLPQGCAVDFDDLANAGRLGALVASTKFKPELGYRFITYASRWIIQAVDREVKCGARTIRAPVRLVDRAIAGDASLDANDRLRTSWRGGVTSLDDGLDGAPRDFARGETPVDERLDHLQEVLRARRAVAGLDDRERKIVELRFFSEAPLPEIGREVRLSGERVRQIEARALRKLREKLTTTL